MSYTFTLNGKSSELKASIFPPIILSEDNNYEIGLVNFVSYNSIPNVDSSNNNFYYGNNEKLTLPDGCYDISDIKSYIETHINDSKQENTAISLTVNRTTLRTEIKCDKEVDFTKENNIGSILGFDEVILNPDRRHIAKHPVNIFKVNAINVECNLVTNSYRNEKHHHILHVFFPKVEPGTKIIENPLNVIYLPINSRYISEIYVKITDQNGDLINFNEETVTIRLHLKKSN